MAEPRFKRSGPRKFSLRFYSKMLGEWLQAPGCHYRTREDAEKACRDLNETYSAFPHCVVARDGWGDVL